MFVWWQTYSVENKMTEGFPLKKIICNSRESDVAENRMATSITLIIKELTTKLSEVAVMGIHLSYKESIRLDKLAI